MLTRAVIGRHSSDIEFTGVIRCLKKETEYIDPKLRALEPSQESYTSEDLEVISLDLLKLAIDVLLIAHSSREAAVPQILADI